MTSPSDGHTDHPCVCGHPDFAHLRTTPDLTATEVNRPCFDCTCTEYRDAT